MIAWRRPLSKLAVVESWPRSRASAAASFGEIELSVSTETDSFIVARYRGQGCRSLTARAGTWSHRFISATTSRPNSPSLPSRGSSVAEVPASGSTSDTPTPTGLASSLGSPAIASPVSTSSSSARTTPATQRTLNSTSSPVGSARSAARVGLMIVALLPTKGSSSPAAATPPWIGGDSVSLSTMTTSSNSFGRDDRPRGRLGRGHRLSNAQSPLRPAHYIALERGRISLAPRVLREERPLVEYRVLRESEMYRPGRRADRP
jgi:hypothetical protein